MLTLIIGGRNAGKYDYLLDLGYNSEDMGIDFDKPVLYKLNTLIKNLLIEHIDPLEYIKNKIENTHDIVIVCDEVGCGVVPVEKNDREYRETVGRICGLVAKKADVVERIYFSIATRLKG